MNNSDFRSFQVCHFKLVTVHISITTTDLGRLYKLLDGTSRRKHLFPGDDIAVKNTNTQIGAAILKSGHMGYATASP